MTAKPPLQEVGGAVAFLVGDCMVMFSVVALTVMQGTSIAQNMTTNEMTNAFKYKYLQDDKGNIRNPFNRGCYKNCNDFCFATEAELREREPLLLEEGTLNPPAGQDMGGGAHTHSHGGKPCCAHH
mmetsp:Transcript_2626/g.8856  ORF Transcript_2626/g.8856 Transcript_2626/m.8856 type:complete len:126 (-) Transcript_2626:34-411(-)